jgi:crotonobetainyl-CoA:carnitine CoA-transferase CaiB-like acyl-CoA transferase
VCEEGFCDEATRDKDWVNYAVMLLDGREPVAEYERVKGVLTQFFATKTKAELLEASMARRVLLAPVWTTEDVLVSDQFASRHYWEDLAHPDLGTVRYPGAFARFPAAPLEVLPAAPALGADTEAVLAEPPRTPAVAVEASRVSTDPPLQGLKVLDLTWVMAGPAASRVLADYGAEVVRIESETRPDGARTLQPFRDDVTDPHYSGLWNNMNAGKRELSLNLAKPEAIDVLWDLVEWADVVLEAFSPGSLARMGISPEAMLERKPELVVASSCLMGQTGPLAKLAGFGTMAAAISGFFYPVGWPDRAPCGPFGAYTDYTSPRWFATAILAAVEHQRATGHGQHVDFSQAESAMHLLGPALLERSLNGRTWERAGNTDLVHAPHSVYPALGDDRWIAVACTDQEQWRALATEIGHDGLGHLDRAERKQREAELDALIAAWTSGRDAVEAMTTLQARGVPSHVVQNSDEAATDPQLLHRNHFVEVAHSTQPGGTTVVEGTRFVLSRTPASITNGGPTFGEHTFEILTDNLGYDGDRIADLAVAEALE